MSTSSTTSVPRPTNRFDTSRPRPAVRACLAAVLLLPLLGCEPTNSPVMIDEAGMQQQAVVEGQEADSVDIRARPTFTPFTQAPSITNRSEVVSAMVRAYPPLLRDAGIGGTVRVYFFINEQGVAEQVRLEESSGHAALDDAALNVAGVYAFEPALNDETPVPVWVQFPITFQVR